MITTRQKNKIYDAAQRIWVQTCVAVTLGASVFIGYSLYNYFTKVKPLKQEMEERFKEELLKEGRATRQKSETETN